MNDETGITFEDNITGQLDRMEKQVNELYQIVTSLLGGLAAAQNAGGMQGMMARQLPDVSQLIG